MTLLEVLVVPYRANNQVLAARYERLLTRSRGVRLIDVSNEQLRQAAQLRASTGIRVADALQVSAARAAGCRILVTNDRRLPALPDIRVLQLSDYAQQAEESPGV